MEPLSDANLLYLLAERAHIDAGTVVPEQWRNPVADPADESEVSGQGPPSCWRHQASPSTSWSPEPLAACAR